jgi:hypothetical protein
MEIEDISERLPRRGQYKTRAQVKSIVVHHSASPAHVTPEAIAKYHVDVRGYPGIAYHYLVYPDRVFQVNPVMTITWHAGDGTGDERNENTYGIGICLVGNFNSEPPPPEQIDRAARLIDYLCDRYGITRIIGHKEGWYKGKYGIPTDCPGKTWEQWEPMLLRRDERSLLWSVRAGWPDWLVQFARERKLGAPQPPEMRTGSATLYPFANGIVVVRSTSKEVVEW